MKSPMILETADDTEAPVAENRRILCEANVFAVSLIGGQGCGKTSLIEASIKQFKPDVRVGVIACNVDSHFDVSRVFYGSSDIVAFETPCASTADASLIHEALLGMDLENIDILFIEDAGRPDGAQPLDLGQGATVAVFSVPGGHDKAGQHSELVGAAEVVVLSKTDLLPVVPFDLSVFRSDVRYLNDAAELFEISALHGYGLDQWINWLHARIKKHRAKASHWFG